MKFSVAAVVAVSALGAVRVQAQSGDDKTYMDLAIWCCFDSNEACKDACDFINDCEKQETYGLHIMPQPPVPPGVIVCSPDDLIANGGTGHVVGPIPLTMRELGISAFDTVDDIFDTGNTSPEGVPALCAMKTQMKADMLTGGAESGFTCGIPTGPGGSVTGDPHFKTWAGENFDYQGECDLQFLSAPHFAKDLGLDIQIRTKIRFDYSYIESAAIKIGQDVLEVSGWGEYLINGVMGAHPKANGEQTLMMGDIPVTHEANDKRHHTTHIFRIDLAESHSVYASLKIQTFKSWVSIHVEHPQEEDFKGSVGMLGSFPKGEKLGRDGSVFQGDENAFGQEWQVLATDQSLFGGVREPQSSSGAACKVPQVKTASAQRRRLVGTEITEEMARDACADVPSHQDYCVHDVLASQDLEMAQAGAF